MSAPARPFEQTVDIETPELVAVSYSIAGIGSRVLAALTDLGICAAGLALLLTGVAFLAPRIKAFWSKGLAIWKSPRN